MADDGHIAAARREELRRAERREQDLRDYDDEVNDRANGKTRRFTREEDSTRAVASRRERSWTETVRLTLEIAQFRQELDELDRASAKALEDAERREREARQRLELARDRATCDPQGRHVYRTADGHTAFYDDASEVGRDEFGRIQWRRNAPTWEERRALGDDVIGATRRREEVAAYRDQVRRARERTDDGEQLEADELARLRAGVRNMPDAVRANLPVADVSLSAAAAYDPDDRFAGAPSASDAFDRVRRGTPPAPALDELLPVTVKPERLRPS